MRRMFMVLAMWLSLALGAQAIPARLPYVRDEPPTPPKVPVLANTVWRGTLYDANSRIVFMPDGTLTYGEVGGTSPGSWRLVGNKLYFEINKYSEYDTVLMGDIIQGDGINKAGQTCKPLLKRVYNETPTGPALVPMPR